MRDFVEASPALESGQRRLRVLLLSSCHQSEAENKREKKGFIKMVETLDECGIEAEHRAIRFERDLFKAIVYSEPDIVFNALSVADHAPEPLRGIQKAIQERGYSTIGTELETLGLIDSSSALHEKWRMAGIDTRPSLFAEKYPSMGARFFSVGIIGNNDRAVLLPAEVLVEKGTLLESVTDRDLALGHAAVVAVEGSALKKDLVRFAVAAFGAAGVKDFARLELVMVENRLFALRIKAQPQIPDTIFDACAELGGLSARQRTIAIFIAGFARLFIAGKASIVIPPRMRASIPLPYFSILYG